MADNLNMHLNICTLFIPQCTAVMVSRHAEKKTTTSLFKALQRERVAHWVLFALRL